MDNHSLYWENSLCRWPFSIAMLRYQRVNAKLLHVFLFKKKSKGWTTPGVDKIHNLYNSSMKHHSEVHWNCENVPWDRDRWPSFTIFTMINLHGLNHMFLSCPGCQKNTIHTHYFPQILPYFPIGLSFTHMGLIMFQQEVYASVPRALWAEIVNLHGASRRPMLRWVLSERGGNWYFNPIWFGGLEHFLCFQILGIIIPIDVHIFQRGWNHQLAIGSMYRILTLQLGHFWDSQIFQHHGEHGNYCEPTRKFQWESPGSSDMTVR